jgi:hypothetical protein
MISMHGLDLSFLKNGALPKAKKHRKAVIKSRRSDLAAPMVMSDIKPFVSPVTSEVISSRSQLERHNRVNGVRQCGDVSPKAMVEHIKSEHEKRRKPAEGIQFEWTRFQV